MRILNCKISTTLDQPLHSCKSAKRKLKKHNLKKFTLAAKLDFNKNKISL